MAWLALCDWRHGLTWLGTRATMTLFILLICFPLCILPEELNAQKFEFVVLKTSVTKEQSKTILSARNPFVFRGHTLQMVCRYRVSSDGQDYCDQETNNSFVVEPYGKVSAAKAKAIQSKMVEVGRTKCNLTVEFRNMTTDMEGRYLCKDKSGLTRESNIEVGDAPVAPRNISVVYSPMHSIAVKFDPVRTGLDLDEPGTTWKVEYKWSYMHGYTECPKGSRMCRTLKKGLCQACLIRLRLKDYHGCGQYTGFGSIVHNVSFNISVTNKFGEVVLPVQKINLLDWVQPNPFARVEVARRGPSDLHMVVRPSQQFDKAHVDLMNMTKHPLRIQWSVDLVSARDQSLLLPEGMDFYNRYGFVRNLEDDLEALNQVLLGDFPNTSKLLEPSWEFGSQKYCKLLSSLWFPITGLPLPGYFYNISVQSFARYPGQRIFLNTTKTGEAAPQVGPGLHDSFAYCEVTGTACVSCVVHFREIPLCRRGGVVTHYTATVTLTNSSRLQHQGGCRANTTQVFEAKGQDNSVLIHGLEAGGEYLLRLQAHNAAGPSAASTKILHVHAAPPPTAPRNIVLEIKESASLLIFDLYWAPPDYDQHDQLQYFVHHCNATLRPSKSNSFMQYSHCVTNMVSRPVEKGVSTFSFIQTAPRDKDLTAAFFVSTVTPDGRSSGLQKVGCFYSRNGLQSKVSVQTVIPSADALSVRFPLPCGEDHRHRYDRPDWYAIGVRRLDSLVDSCKESCGKLMAQTDYVQLPLTPQDNLQGGIKYDWRGLEAGKGYCVGVSVGHSGQLLRWSCLTANTTAAPESSNDAFKNMIISVIISALTVILLIFLLCYCWKSAKKRRAKFTIPGSAFKIHVPESDKTYGMRTVLPTVSDSRIGGQSNSVVPSDSGISSLPTETGSAGVTRDRYSAVETSDQHYPCASELNHINEEERSSDSDREQEAGFHRSESAHDQSDDSEYSSQDGSGCAEQSLTSSSSRYKVAPQQPRISSQHTLPVLQSESRPLLHPSHWGGEDTGGSSSSADDDDDDDGKHDDENTFSPDVPRSEQFHNTNSSSAAGRSSFSLTSPRLPGSRDMLHPQLDMLPMCDQLLTNPLPQATPTSSGTSANPCSRDHSQTGQPVSQLTDTIGPYSIDDILHAFQNSQDVGGGASGSAESEPLLLENILRDAAMCPWRDQVTLHVDPVVHGAACALDDKALGRRDSACFVGEESSATDSAKETDAESETLTRYSWHEQ
ncbi:uncharacterized protein LOC143294722 isoform X2 [Babylonia areolata]|uniref:uncharacterized protein LOC143294722 isoform X2 n=1 Tax=Babylonia areolata TaxID=304850 RepID=UPI003FD080A2